MRRSVFFLPLVFSAFFFRPIPVRAQTASASAYYQQARKLAFDDKKNAAARELCVKALQQDPLFEDARIFEARLYAWDHQYDTARQLLDVVINKNPKHEDALMARSDVAYWDKQYQEALRFCDQGLQYYPSSVEFLLRKVRIDFAAKEYDAAKKAADVLLKQDPDNAEARSLAAALKDYTFHNKAGLGYDYYYFDKQFARPWHIASAEYARVTKAGTVTARFSYGSRYGVTGWQGEAEAYPRLSRRFYTYVNAGFSGSNNNVFPRFRSGFSLFATLPKAWELEAGLRYLQFDDHVWIYTGSIGKYAGKYWFNIKTYLAPGSEHISQSYFFTTRYYYAKADDYISFGIGSGISPDENRNVQIAASSQLTSYRFSTGVHHQFGSNILYANIAWSKDEYMTKTYGNQVNVGIGIQRKF